MTRRPLTTTELARSMILNFHYCLQPTVHKQQVQLIDDSCHLWDLSSKQASIFFISCLQNCLLCFRCHLGRGVAWRCTSRKHCHSVFGSDSILMRHRVSDLRWNVSKCNDESLSAGAIHDMYFISIILVPALLFSESELLYVFLYICSE